MRVNTTGAHFAFGPERDAHEAIWTRENYDVLTKILAALPVHWRFFVKTKIFEQMPTDEPAPSVHDALARVRALYPEVPDVAG